MRLLQNFTIRMVMLTILGLFCLLWSGVGLYSVHALSEVSEGNDIDRHLVRQMTVLSQGNDQYFRFVTRLSRAMDVKIGGGTPDFAPARQSLENMRQKLEEMKALSPGPMNPDISVQLAGLAGERRRSSNATGAARIADRLERTCQYGHARTQSRVRRQRGTV